MTKKVEVKQGKGVVSTSNPDGTTEEETVIVTEDQYTTPTANVGVSGGFTRNLGNYNSMKVQVTLNLPCYIDEIDTIADFASDWVNNRLNTIQDSLGD